MSDTEKLVEEARRAIHGAIPGSGDYDDWIEAIPHGLDMLGDIARAALAVFEKAHTPTDDERGALDAVIEDSIERWGDEFPTPQVAAYVAADVRAAGFRRSEPTCEHGTSLTELCEHVERLVNAEPLDEPSNLNEHTPTCDAWADMNGSVCTCHVEQGEPSDAQVHAGWVAINGAITQAQMLTALRAAGGVR